MIYLLIVMNGVLLMTTGYFFYRFIKVLELYDRLHEDQFLLQMYTANLKTALNFYVQVAKDSPQPQFNWEVAEKALKGELH